MISRRILLLLALGVGLAGCGSSSTTTVTATTSPTTGTTTSPTPTTTETTTGSAAADQRVARDAQLKLSDFPSGWEQKDRTQESVLAGKCQGVEGPKAAASARQQSPKFEKTSRQALSTVYIFADVPSAMRAFGELSSESTRVCLADAAGTYLSSQSQQGAEFGKVTSAQVSSAPVGDESAVSRLTLPFKANGLGGHAYFDFVFVRVGRGVATVQFLDFFSPFEESLRTRLTTRVVDRLKAGLAQSA